MNGLFLARVWNNKTSGNIFSFLECIVHIGNILSITGNKGPINMVLIFKFQFDKVHGKMLNDPHLKVLKVICESDKRPQLPDYV